MAEPENKEEAANEEQPEKKGMMGKLIIGAVVGAIVVLETFVVSMMLPDPNSIAEEVRQEIREKAQKEGLGMEDILDVEDTGPVVEVEIGDFNVSIHQHTANVTLHVTCKVMATVAESEKSNFDSLLASNKNRLREKILVELRSAEVTDLTKPGLGLIKRRILEKSNRLFEKPILKSIVIADFNYQFM